MVSGTTQQKGTGMSEEMWVIEGSLDSHDRVQRLLRGLVLSPAARRLTPADILAAVRTLPEVDRSWKCAEHGGDFLERSPSKYALCLTMLYEDAWNALPEPEPCKPIRVLIVPLPEEGLMGADLPRRKPGTVALEDVFGEEE